MLGPGLRVASSWRMGRCESAIHSHLLSEGLAVHFSREQGSLSLNSTLTEVLIDVSRAPGAIETILTPLLKTRESTNHSIDLTELISTVACGQKVLEVSFICSPGSYMEGFRFVKNSRANFH